MLKRKAVYDDLLVLGGIAMALSFAGMHSGLSGLALHPSPNDLRAILVECARLDRNGLASLWLSEGIPFAFLGNAAAYEQMRVFISKELGLHSKSITVVGSARIGFSLKPDHFGRVFGAGSDLDVCIVDHALFKECEQDANLFVAEFSDGLLQARSSRESFYWSSTVKYLGGNIKAGFVDTWKIPVKYLAVKRVMRLMDQVSFRLAATEEVPKFEKVTARVYKDWHSLTERVSFNLNQTRCQV